MDFTFTELVGWAGGAGAVVSGLGYIIGQLVIINRTQKWKDNADIKIAILQDELAKRSNLLNNLIDIQKSNYSLSQEKRIAAVEEIWKVTNDFMLSLPNSFIYVNNLNINDYETYLTRSVFKDGEDIRKDIIDIENNENSTDLFEIYRNKLIYLRPFLGEDLYFSIHSYYSFVVHVFIYTIRNVEKNKLKHWQENNYTKRLVDKALSEDDIMVIVSDKKNSFNYVLQQMERNILKNMSLLLSGKKASQDSHKHTEELMKVLSESDNNAIKKPLS